MIDTVVFSGLVALIANSVAFVVRWSLIRSFVFQLKAEQAADSFKLLFNNLPDAVILLTKQEAIAH
jgi:hypothetical protein